MSSVVRKNEDAPVSLVAVVPVRGGSRGLPGKNVRDLAGVPLYLHAVRQAQRCGADVVIVSTDIDEILDGADADPTYIAHRRPVDLRGDDIPMDLVLVDALALPEAVDSDVILLQATSPLRTDEHVRDCVRLYRRGRFELVLSVRAEEPSVLKCGTSQDGAFIPLRSAVDTFSNRQSLPEVYRPNGAVYVFGSSWMRGRQTLATDSIGMYEMDSESSVDIDVLEDFERCETLLARRRMEKS